LKLSTPDELNDNTDKALAELINEFYKLAVEKIIQYLSREELLSVEKEVQRLKGMNSY
jgi:hypothetical protein